jgi:hypothetical protein
VSSFYTYSGFMIVVFKFVTKNRVQIAEKMLQNAGYTILSYGPSIASIFSLLGRHRFVCTMLTLLDVKTPLNLILLNVCYILSFDRK